LRARFFSKRGRSFNGCEVEVRTMSSATAFEIASLATSAFLLLGYNLLALLSRGTNLVIMLRADALWTLRHGSIAHGGAQDVVAAVQTLRNSVLVAVFIGTVSFNTMTGALAGLRRTDKRTIEYADGLVVALLSAGSFLCFAVCIRCAAHSGYVVGGASFLETAPARARISSTTAAAAAAATAAAAGTADANSSTDAAVAVASKADTEPERLRAHLLHLVRMQSVFFSVAFRLLYSSIPFLFATAGPVVLLSASAIMCVFLACVDFAHRVDSFVWVGSVL
jgi:Protein of unknown function, DUF599